MGRRGRRPGFRAQFYPDATGRFLLFAPLCWYILSSSAEQNEGTNSRCVSDSARDLGVERLPV